MQLLRLMTIGILVSCAAGCSTYQVSDVVSTHKDRKTSWYKAGVGVEMINPYQFTPPGETEALYKTAASGTDEHLKMVARNRLQTVVMTLSDKAVAKHLSKVTGTEVTVNMLFGAGALAATGGAAVAPASAAKAFTQTAGGLIGMKGIFNDEVYKSALVQTLIASIIADRNLLRATIKASQMLSTSNYSVDEALLDANEYHSRGSFYYGLTLIRQAAEEKNIARANNITNAVTNATVQLKQKMQLQAAQTATLSAGSSADITTVEQLTDRLKALIDAGDRTTASRILTALQIEIKPNEDVFKLLDAQIKALKAGDKVALDRLAKAFNSK